MDSPSPIQPITLQDCAEAGQVLGRAFADELVSVATYKGATPEARSQNLATDFTIEVEDCLRRGIALQIRHAGKMVAAATVYPPGAYPLPWRERMRMVLNAILEFYRYDVIKTLTWLREAAKIHPKEAHFYFQYMGVLPEYQGKGYGTAMMRYVTTLADQAEMPCYLETASVGAVPMYRRYGFEAVVEKKVIGVQAWFMWREARKMNR